MKTKLPLGKDGGTQRVESLTQLREAGRTLSSGYNRVLAICYLH